ncbi:hypothetical protein E1293_45755 [Actinomadura darangshiensis]|uniref:Uncharacterized protein n=1 Tax=Actinomadura darangshiensis TaxID=705336 RepID=A0A4R4ZP31_9ACTN|nr:hypothetical protein E1293_45755 [Actinomadura darangshiensis]
MSDGQFYLVDAGTQAALLYSAGRNGLVGVLGDGAACVCTGTLEGLVRLTAQASQEPPLAHVGDWDEVVEIAFHSPSGRFSINGVANGPPLPNLAVAGPGYYRVRVHARGRDAGHGAETVTDVNEIVEEFLIICWPGDGQPEAVHQTRDQVGIGLRAAQPDPSIMPPIRNTAADPSGRRR